MDHQSSDSNWEKAERLDWHLWLLAILLIFVLGISLVSFMFPAVFWLRDGLPLKSSERAFFGFCLLLALVLVYLVQRQATVRALKRQLYEAQSALLKAQREAAAQAFLDLPGIVQFRDALAMEYRRASVSGQRLADVVLRVPGALPQTLGSVAQVLKSLLRPGESMYRIADDAIAVVLPGMKTSDAAHFCERVKVLSGGVGWDLRIEVTGYPDNVLSLTELEAPFRSAALSTKSLVEAAQ